MRVLLFNIFFGRDMIGTGCVSSDLVEALVVAGHEVRVVTTSADYGALRPGSVDREPYAGASLSVVRIPVPFGLRSPKLRRAALYGLYLLLAAPVGMFGARPDVVVSVLPPSIAGIPAALVGWIRRVPLVLDVEDLYSASDIQPSLASRFNSSIERWMIRRAVRIRVLTNELLRIVVEWARPGCVVENVPVWADTLRIDPDADSIGFRRQHGLEGRFVLMHAGNVGAFGGQTALLSAAIRMKERDDVRFVFVGGGYGIGPLRDSSRVNGLRNMVFLERVSKEQLSATLAAGDLMMATHDPRIGIGGVPSKVFAYMAAGRPIVAALNPRNGAAESILRAGCGWVVSTGSGEAIEAAVCAAIALTPEQRAAMGLRGRDFVMRHHDRAACVSAFIRLIESAAKTCLPPDGR